MSTPHSYQNQKQQRAWRVISFVAAQLMLLSVAWGAVTQRMAQLEAGRSAPALRHAPPQVAPTYDDPRIVSDEQLNDVLVKLYPRLRGPQPKINHVDHALRFWGVSAVFPDSTALSGEEMRKILTDHSEFSRLWGKQESPLLLLGEHGVKIRTQEGLATASHVDHTVAGLAEVGTHSDFPVHLANGSTATMGDLVHQAWRAFRPNQAEYEWSALTFALCFQPTTSFMTSEGQRISFDDLADRIMRQPLRQGVCYGNHRLHTLVMLLRIDDRDQLLSPAGRNRILAHLTDASRRLAASQHQDGYWDDRWPGQDQSVATSKQRDLEAAKILATGHALEWLALAPSEVHPPREVLVRAGQWLSRRITELDDDKVKKYYTFLTHAGRSLALWRGKFPADYLPSSTSAQVAEEQTNTQPPSSGIAHTH